MWSCFPFTVLSIRAPFVSVISRIYNDILFSLTDAESTGVRKNNRKLEFFCTFWLFIRTSADYILKPRVVTKVTFLFSPSRIVKYSAPKLETSIRQDCQIHMREKMDKLPGLRSLKVVHETNGKKGEWKKRRMIGTEVKMWYFSVGWGVGGGTMPKISGFQKRRGRIWVKVGFAGGEGALRGFNWLQSPFSSTFG